MAIGETQRLIVVKYSIQIFDPDGIDRAVKYEPLLVFGRFLTRISYDFGRYAVIPFIGEQVHVSVKIVYRYGFGVKFKHLNFPVVLIEYILEFIVRVNLVYGLENSVDNYGFTEPGEPHDHHSISHLKSFKKLVHFI